MLNIIEKYINSMNIEDVNKFALSPNIHLSEEELSFTYNFIKKNYKDFFNNPNVFDIDRYKNNYSNENFIKVKNVFIEYLSKYKKYL